MSPAEAGAVLLEEPDWLSRYQNTEFDRTSPIDLAMSDAFEVILREYRRFHCTGEAPNRDPMPVVPALIALAKLGVMPPPQKNRSGHFFYEQNDDHCWLVNERAWRIVAIEARTMFLDSFGDQKQIDMNAVNWDKYVEARTKVLDHLSIVSYTP